MKTLLKKLWASFDNAPGGFSARKLSAFVAVMGVAVVITHRYTDRENLAEILTIWLAFALLCLGIITAQQVVEFRTGKTNQTESEAPK